MKKLLATLLLLCSLSAWADATQDWNKRFYELNPKAGKWNPKWDQSGQQKYLKTLLASSVGDQYFNPDDYRLPVAPIPPAPYVPPVVQNETTTANHTSLQDALKAAQTTVKAIEDLIARGI